MLDYYKVLNVARNASDSEIKKAYKKLTQKWHPAKNPDNLEEANKRIRELFKAYKVLSNEKKRRIYDKYLKKEKEDQAQNQSESEHFHDTAHNLMAGTPFEFRPMTYDSNFFRDRHAEILRDANVRSQSNGATSSRSQINFSRSATDLNININCNKYLILLDEY
ncbi:dnaJ homolog subfamily B member 6-A-like [Drosophila innubila]|uniref:dnaJ homolog subfamily B member 6-A-like n=1 Tax=Drosophila innubila TaxID=198719 RepID=UPI00148DD0C1|nr:dnaJ homolog subfamily B member 6-A-like [Drosophila innubila]